MATQAPDPHPSPDIEPNTRAWHNQDLAAGFPWHIPGQATGSRSDLQWLSNIGYLRGVTLGREGPVAAPRQAATPKKLDRSFFDVRQNFVVSDEHSKTESNARYFHLGWPTPNTIVGRPWDILDPGDVDSVATVRWASRRLASTHFTINMSYEDLDPSEEFKQAIRDALAYRSVAGRIAAMRNVFVTWGEVIPLVAEVGISLTATGSLRRGQDFNPRFTPPGTRAQDIVTAIDSALGVIDVFDRRLESRVQGGDIQELLIGGSQSWLQSAKPRNFAMVKVTRAIPIIDILDQPLRDRVRNLYSATSIYSFSAKVGVPRTFGFHGTENGFRNIASIKVWFNTARIEAIAIRYDNNVIHGPHGPHDGTQFDEVPIKNGEYITDIFVWANSERVLAIRFVKNTGLVSPHFGAWTLASDPPQLLSSNSAALVGLSGAFDHVGLTQLQAVWRNDIEVLEHWPTQTSFAGGIEEGVFFNDLEYIGNPFTARLSRITLRDGGTIANFQTRYVWDGPEGVVGAETPVRGVEKAGRRVTFELAEDEYILQVMGKHDALGLYQLQFRTNKRTSPLFGKEGGTTSFDLTAPAGMRLYYFVGKSRGWVDSLLCVWAPIADL